MLSPPASQSGRCSPSETAFPRRFIPLFLATLDDARWRGLTKLRAFSVGCGSRDAEMKNTPHASTSSSSIEGRGHGRQRGRGRNMRRTRKEATTHLNTAFLEQTKQFFLHNVPDTVLWEMLYRQELTIMFPYIAQEQVELSSRGSQSTCRGRQYICFLVTRSAGHNNVLTTSSQKMCSSKS